MFYHRIVKDALISLILISSSAFCYPVGKSDLDNMDSEEQNYPNGTVVGKYSYKDNEGNPVQVKYYADDSSYGVELKSVKVVNSTDTPTEDIFKQTKANSVPQSDPALVLGAEFYNPTNIKIKTSDPFEILKKENKETPMKLEYKPSPEYEVYFQNELKAPKKCGKEKVRVYFDKDKRKTRDTLDSLDETAKICCQF